MKKLFKPLADVGDDSIIHIIHDEQDRLEAISDYGYEDLVPLTADDMWQFMPWQDVNDAPKTGWFLVIENCTSKIQLAKRYLDDEFIDEFSRRIVFEKWLPLPQVSK